jgi:hypothetical protein
MGEHGAKPSKVLRPWTDEEIRRLRELAGRAPAAEIARELGRTVGSVKGQAHGLALSLWVQRDEKTEP